MLSRDIPVVPEKSALLFIDVQNFSCSPEGAEYKDEGLSAEEAKEKYRYFFDQLEIVIPKMRELQAACRNTNIEVIYTVIESLTKDGRDRSLDYKITGFNVPKGSWDAKVINAIKPADDEIVIPKTSSSVFISTNLHYVLGNLGVKHLIVSGFLTDQCISSAVRDACDLGYLVTLVTDACASHSQERHDVSIEHIKGYCRRMSTHNLINELSST